MHAVADLRNVRAAWEAAADELREAGEEVLSEGAGVDAALRVLSWRRASVDRQVAVVSELLMATAEMADVVWEIETAVKECGELARAKGVLIRDDGLVCPVDEPLILSLEGVSCNSNDASDEVRQEVARVIASAESADAKYARRLKAVECGDVRVEDSLSHGQGLPAVPLPGWSVTEVAAWWAALPPEDQASVIALNPDMVGRADGVSLDARNEANRIVLERELAQAEADVDKFRRSAYGGHPYSNGQELREARRRLADLQAIQAVLDAGGESPETRRTLLFLDCSGSRVEVAIGVGDVAGADKVGLILPGMGNDPANDLADYVEEKGVRLRDQADSLLTQGTEQRSGVSVATILWMYDTPGFPDVASTASADRAVPEVTSFLEGMSAERSARGLVGDRDVLGHSYGSMVAGKVVDVVRVGVVDDIVYAASPGSGVQDVSELNNTGGAYVVGVNTNDAVQGLGPDRTFGRDPMKMDGVVHLANNPERDSNDRIVNTPVGPVFGMEDPNPFSRHSECFEGDTESLKDMARVLGDLPIKGEQSPM